ncbi:hypothetical protein CPC08DRAFT_754705 [Agrocybe pediades]|nr:hypothetical protein CPC08DRAFT_754705 [Agrocybe pediades]
MGIVGGRPNSVILLRWLAGGQHHPAVTTSQALGEAEGLDWGEDGFDVIDAMALSIACERKWKRRIWEVAAGCLSAGLSSSSATTATTAARLCAGVAQSQTQASGCPFRPQDQQQQHLPDCSSSNSNYSSSPIHHHQHAALLPGIVSSPPMLTRISGLTLWEVLLRGLVVFGPGFGCATVARRIHGDRV